MANKRIDQLNPNLETLSGSELIPIFDTNTNTTERITVNDLSEFIGEDIFTTGTTLNGGIIEYHRNDISNAYSTDLTPILSGFSTTDTFVTGGTYDNGTLIFDRNDGNSFSIFGLYTDTEIVRTVKITTSVVTSSTNFSNSDYTVTFPSSGTYMIDGFVKVKSSSSTVGFGLALSDTSNNNRRTELMLYGSSTATAASTSTNFFSYFIGNTQVISNPTTGVLSTVNGNYSFTDVKGFITVSTSTTMAIQLRAETTGTVELESPSYLKFIKI
jgi:hypothetical protein